MTAGPAHQVPDRQAGHPRGHRGLGARVSRIRTGQGSSHVPNSTGNARRWMRALTFRDAEPQLPGLK